MTNFSFDYGNAHYLVLDANAYMDWTDEKLRAWLEEDLKTASQATWRIAGATRAADRRAGNIHAGGSM